jgi:hypothetical protein
VCLRLRKHSARSWRLVQIGLEQRSTHFYGYPEGSDVVAGDIKQAYTLFNLGAQLMNARKSDFSYQLGGNFSFINDKFKATESTVDLLFKGAYKINDEQAINLNADYSIINRKDVDVEAKSRNLFQLNGYYSFVTKSDFYLQLGATVALENDSIDSKDFHFYPDVKLTYALNDAVDVVGSLSGGMEKVSLQTLSNENIWLAPSIATFHTNKKFDINAGIRAKLGGKVSGGSGDLIRSAGQPLFFVTIRVIHQNSWLRTMTEQQSAQTFMHRYYLPIRMLQNSHCKAIIMHTPRTTWMKPCTSQPTG